MTSAARLRETHLFPVRHHSPRSSAVLRAFLDRVDPALVLVEGPSDATALIDVLVDPATVPPVALLGHRTDGVEGTVLWPFAAYSPEYVALRWAAERGRERAFIDLPVGQAIAAQAMREDELDERAPAPSSEAAGRAPSAGEAVEEAIGAAELCARARGFRSFEEFWEASFEAPAYEPDAFRALLLAYADLVRAGDRRLLGRARDAFMARAVLARIDAGTPPGAIVVVAGAAHAAAFAAGDVDDTLLARLPAPVPCASTVVPYSFPRLAEQLGYGAGNRAPQFYQRAHAAGCDYRRAALEVLVELAEHLRLRGFSASLADVLEAYRLAIALTGLRDKAEPGLDEVREAAVATLCRGDAEHVDGFLWASVVGQNVGRVAGKVGRTSLQEEFWREVRARRLPDRDTVEPFVLKLGSELEVATSVFLHRLRVAGVPYATCLGDRIGHRHGGGHGAPGPAGGHAALHRASEAWEAQWTPATDVALVEKIVLGETLERVAARVLRERLAAARSTGDASDVLLEAVITASPATVALALVACDRFAAGDDDLPSLARACRALGGLVAYGSSRALSALGDDALPALCAKTFTRAVLRVPGACAAGDAAIAPAKDALRTLHELALAQPLVDRDAWLAAAREVATSYAVNPSAAGLAAGLLYLAQVLDDAAIAHLVGQRLSDTLAPERAAGFLGGFLEVNALVLVRSRPVVAALDAFLTGIDADRFPDALPVLRRAFSTLGPTERRYLLDNVLALRRPAAPAQPPPSAAVVARDKATLDSLHGDLAQAMDDLDDLL